MLNMVPRPRGGDAESAAWYDLLSPTADEIALVERRTGATVPARDALSEIERSSRLQRRAGVLTMSTPTTVRGSTDGAAVAPLGFVLSGNWLVTVRFAALPAFDAVLSRLGDGATPPPGSLGIFAELCEEIVDHVADGLERIAECLGALSSATFAEDGGGAGQAVRATRLLREQLREVGRIGDRLSEVRDGLVGLGRVMAYTEQHGCSTADVGIAARLTNVRQDLASPSDYNEHLTGKVQFVLDALVGLIGIAQNDIFRVLTIVSIVGIAPTLIAGIYGMNFKNIPEYDWTYGYQYGLAVIALSGLAPLVWFKVKGWF